MRVFDHNEKDVLKAYKVSVEEFREAVAELPTLITIQSELVELMCKAGHNPAKNLAIFLAFCDRE